MFHLTETKLYNRHPRVFVDCVYLQKKLMLIWEIFSV